MKGNLCLGQLFKINDVVNRCFIKIYNVNIAKTLLYFVGKG